MAVVMKRNKKNNCALHPWGFVVESARRYKCPGVHDVFGY